MSSALDRQPVHTVYGGAHLFKPEISSALGSKALDSMRTYASDAGTFAESIGLRANEELIATVYQRTIAKLEREPVEDYRIDFEDGYGIRSNDEEDAHAVSTARAVAAGSRQPQFPPFIGIRIKPLTEISRPRSVRTLKLFLETLASEGGIPANFAVTLPKVTAPQQVAELVRLLEPFPSVRIELMIETPQSITDASGQFAIPKLLNAAEGRCRGLHFGAYDYTASCDITAEHQSLTHPACDVARDVMQVSSAGRGVLLSDGATNILPISKDRAVVQRALRLHFEHVQRSVTNGFYQGWDLHPAQLPTRYAAVYAFFLQGFDAAAARLRNFVEQSAQATRVGEVFDDAATGRGLLNFFRRGINCGAFTEQEAAAAGLTGADF
jgi:citrate lyase beta subunit